jgi:type I restriction enzyme, S subunit
VTVPKLRFPEFQDALEWEEKEVGKVCKSFSGGTPSTSEKSFYGGNIPFIRSAEIAKSRTELFLTNEGLASSASKLVMKGDVLVALYGANSGDVAIARLDGAINQAILCLRSENSNPFIYQFLTFKKEWIISTFVQGGQGNLSGEIIKSVRLGFPSLLEQQKIADCLSSIDDLITAQSQKLESLETHKKGLMQQLFPSEGETVPKLRFPEFQDALEWEEKLLHQLVKSVTTGKLDANAMVQNGAYRFYTCAKNYYWIDKYAFDGEALLVAGNGAYLGYIHYYSGKFNAYQRTYVLQGFDVNVLFLKYYLDRNLAGRISTEKKEGNTPYIVMATITDAPVTIPTLLEQQKIADCLTSIDDLITAQSRKLESLKTHKKGLMQQLFPSPDGTQE